MSKFKYPDPSIYEKEKDPVEVNIGDFNYENMKKFGANVTLMRAVPEIIDGLKPVERRSLYATAFLAGALKKKKKMLRIIGAVISIHPHGNMSVEDAIANMSKPWETLYPLISIKGNNGQPSGVRHAAARYLDACISDYAYDCFFKEWNDAIVEMSLSYNPEFEEPDYINARFPNILVRPVTGFTFSTTSNFPSFNMEEAFNAVIELIKDPNYEPVLYPDMPSGCTILDEGNFPDICKTGIGTFKMRADVEIDQQNHRLIFRTIPYHTTVQKIIEKISDLKKNGEIPGLVDIFNGSNDFGIDLEIKCGQDVNLQDTLALLYKKTALQDIFNVRMIFVDNYELKQFNLKGVMQKWINNRRIMKHKYFTYNLVKLRERQHILQALIEITESEESCKQMIHDVRHSRTDELVEKLCKRFKGLTSLQAKELTEMKVKQFSVDNHKKFVEEFAKNKELIEEYEELIKKPKKIDKIIIKELKDAIAKYAMPRKCKIVKLEPEHQQVSNSEYNLVFTRKGMIKKLAAKNKSIGQLNDGDDPIQVTKVSNRDRVILFDKGGMVHSIRVSDIVQSELKSKGTQLGRYATLRGDVVMAMPLSDIQPEGEFIFVTERGIIKKTSCSKYAFKSSVISIVLKGDDKLASVIYAKTNADIIVYTENGYGNRFNTNSFSETSRMSSGVIAIDIAEDDRVIGVARVSSKDTHIALITDRGMGKVCGLNTFETGKRRSEVLKLIGMSDKDKLLEVIPCKDGDRFLTVMKHDTVYVEFLDFPELTRNHYGKKLISVPNGEQIIRFFKA